jgi:hypothetical protein
MGLVGWDRERNLLLFSNIGSYEKPLSFSFLIGLLRVGRWPLLAAVTVWLGKSGRFCVFLRLYSFFYYCK